MNNHWDRKTAVSVIGLGYVGLPLACLCAEKKLLTYGIDIDSRKVELIKQGSCPVHDHELQEALSRAELVATANFEVIRNTLETFCCFWILHTFPISLCILQCYGSKGEI